MGGAGVEIVPGAIEVYRQQEDRVEAVLPAIGLGLHQEHLFGQAVGGVGFFGVAVPEVFFFERDGSEFGISADGAQGDEFLHAVQTSLFHQLCSHHKVVVEEFTWIFPIGTYPPYFSC